MPKAAKKTSEAYEGIVLDRVDVQAFSEFLSDQGIHFQIPQGEDSRPYLIDAYKKYLQELVEKDPNLSLLECPIQEGGCGATSTSDLKQCPVCGMSDEADETKQLEEEAKKGNAIELKGDPNTIDTTATIVPVDTSELDATVTRVKTLLTAAVTNNWEIGAELRAIDESGSWKQKLRPNSELPYQTFNDFVQTEIGITPRYATNLMAFNVAFTRDDVAKIGTAKLTAIYQARSLPASERERLLEQGRAGTSLKSIKKEIERLLPPERKSVKAVGGAAGPARQRNVPEPKRGKKSDEITVTYQQGLNELPLEPGSKKGPNAKNILVAQETLVNGVVVSYTIDLAKKVLRIERTKA